MYRIESQFYVQCNTVFVSGEGSIIIAAVAVVLVELIVLLLVIIIMVLMIRYVHSTYLS